MQQKIDQRPSLEINLFGEKPPPDSWVAENIVKHMNIQSEIGVLKDVLLYVRNLQQEQLQKAGSPPLAIKESFTTLPDKGTPTEIGNKLSYNALQSYIKIHTENLETLILLLKQGNPQLSAKMSQMQTQLRTATANFPNLTEEQGNTLTEILSTLTDEGSKAPYPLRRAFCNLQLTLFQNLMGENEGNIKDFQQEIKDLLSKQKMGQMLKQILPKLLKALTANPPTEDQFLQLIVNLQTLANKAPYLSPEQSQAIVSIFAQLDSYQDAKGTPLSKTATDAIVHSKLRAFLKENPNATQKQVKEFFQETLRQSNLQRSTFPFMQSLGNSFEELIEEEGFPLGKGATGNLLATMEGGKIVPNQELYTTLLSPLTIDSQTAKKLENTTSALSTSLESESTDQTAQIEGFTQAVTTLTGTQDILSKGALAAVAQSLQAGQPPLGAAAPQGSDGGMPNIAVNFQKAILGKYMPNQMLYLEELAMALSFDNNCAMFGNKLLQTMLGFDGAANQYNFSNWLGSTSEGDFSSGSVSQAKAKLKAEIEAIEKAIQQVKEALDQIRSQIASIDKQLQGSKLSTQQRANLEQEKGSLTRLEQNLKLLYNPLPGEAGGSGTLAEGLKYLKNICIGPPTGKGHTAGHYFRVYEQPPGPPWIPPPSPNWRTQIGDAENLIVNGTSKGHPSGGLINVQAQAQTFQQNYSDQSQTLQMTLQMRMTEIQQEWSVVSSALQSIFQAYGVFSQSIYK